MTETITAPETKRITLYYREGSSDKVYQAAIEPQGELFVVNFAYGRRGSTLNTGTKTQTPVDHETAKHIYDKLVREKMAKGYTEGPDGTPYVDMGTADRPLHRHTQLRTKQPTPTTANTSCQTSTTPSLPNPQTRTSQIRHLI